MELRLTHVETTGLFTISCYDEHGGVAWSRVLNDDEFREVAHALLQAADAGEPVNLTEVVTKILDR